MQPAASIPDIALSPGDRVLEVNAGPNACAAQTRDLESTLFAKGLGLIGFVDPSPTWPGPMRRIRPACLLMRYPSD